MDRVLDIQHDGCLQGILYGLGNQWAVSHARREAEIMSAIEAIIDRFLATHRDLRPELSEFARRARSGFIGQWLQ